MTTRSFATFLALALLPLSAFGWEHGRDQVKLLTDSAAALSTTHPDLSQRLQDLAAREGTETEANEEHGPTQKQDALLLRDAAAALRPQRPDLARGLDRFAAEESGEKGAGAPQGESGAMQSQPAAPSPAAPNGGY